MRKTHLVSLSLATVLLVGFSGCQNDNKTQNSEPKQMQEQVQQKVEEKTADTKQETPKVQEVQQTTSQPTATQEIAPTTQKAEETPKKGNPSKGQKIFAKRLKEACGVNGGTIAKQHTQDEWSAIIKEGKLADTISATCHGATIKDKYLLDLGAFFMQYASDSGNIPSC